MWLGTFGVDTYHGIIHHLNLTHHVSDITENRFARSKTLQAKFDILPSQSLTVVKLYAFLNVESPTEAPSAAISQLWTTHGA